MQNWLSFQTYCVGLATETRISPDSRRCWGPRCFCAKAEANTPETFQGKFSVAVRGVGCYDGARKREGHPQKFLAGQERTSLTLFSLMPVLPNRHFQRIRRRTCSSFESANQSRPLSSGSLWLSLLAWVRPQLHLAEAIFILKNCNESSVRKPSILLSKSCHSTLICVFSCLIPAECFPIKKPGLRLFPGRDEGGGRGNWICQWKAWSWGLKNPFKSIYFPYRWHADWQKKKTS